MIKDEFRSLGQRHHDEFSLFFRCVVWTGDGRVFFYNPSSRTSVWERPEDLVGRADVDKMVSTPPETAATAAASSTSAASSSSDSSSMYSDIS